MELCQPDFAEPKSRPGNVCCLRLAEQRQAASVSGRSGSGVAGTGTPLMGDHLKEFFCVEQFTGWEGKFRLNLPGDLVRHIEPHVERQRIPPVQERLDERKLFWSRLKRQDNRSPTAEQRRGSQLKKLEGDVLGGDEEFAGKGRLGRAALQGLFGGEADEIGIVVFLRNVSEDEIARDRIEAVGIAKIFADGVIRKMAGAAEDALLDDPWIRADLEHVEIVIRFENQAIGAAEMDFDKLRHVAEVGDDSHFRAVRTKGESDGISRVVRNSESVDVNVADCEVLARLDGFDAFEPLA